MSPLKIKCGYSPEVVKQFIKEYHDFYSNYGSFQPFDLTLTTCWGNAAEEGNWASPHRYTLLDDDTVIGLFQGLVQKKFFFTSLLAGFTSGYGVVVHPQYPSKETLQFFLSKVFQQERHHAISQIFLPRLVDVPGYLQEKHYSIYLQLNVEFESIWKNMDKKRRNAIRKALREGIGVGVSSSISELKNAYKILRYTALRKSFAVPPWGYVSSIYEHIPEIGGKALVFTAYKDGIPLSVALILGFDKKLMLWKAGSTVEGYRKNAGSLVQIKIIEWGIENGFLIYDMGGTNPYKSMYSGIHRFKSSFGGKLVSNVLLYREKPYYNPLNSIYSFYRWLKK